MEGFVEWFRIDAVHRLVVEGCRGWRLRLGEGDVVAHLVSLDGDVYGVHGIGIDVLEMVFDNLVRFERVSMELRSCWLLRFSSMAMDFDSIAIHRRCGLLYLVSRIGGRYRLGVAALCKDRGTVQSVAKAMGASDAELVEDLDVEKIVGYLRSCPEIDPSNIVKILRPVRSRIVSTPLTIDLVDVPSHGLYLGYLLDPLFRRKKRAWLPYPLGHTIIVGATGSGKSTTLRRLCIELSRYLPVAIIDWVGEHSEALQGSAKVLRLGVDISIPLREGSESVEQFIDRLSYYIETAWSCSLTPLQRRILLSIVTKIGNPTIDRLLTALSTWLSSDRKDYVQSADALISRLSILAPLRNVFDPTKPRLEVPTTGITVIDLSSVEPTYLRKIAAHALLYALLRRARVERKRLVIAVDEAHNLLDTDSRNIVVEAFLEYRKFGIEMVIATSSFVDMPRQIVENASIVIAHRIPSLRQAETIADLFGSSRREKEMWIETLRTLGTGVAAIVTRDSPHPLLVEIEPYTTTR